MRVEEREWERGSGRERYSRDHPQLFPNHNPHPGGVGGLERIGSGDNEMVGLDCTE